MLGGHVAAEVPGWQIGSRSLTGVPPLKRFAKPATMRRFRNGHDTASAIKRNARQQDAWMMGGPNGAAARLGSNRTTLISKMRKLGISRETAFAGLA
jgi:formate hydrogenlyase transcriptional activator